LDAALALQDRENSAVTFIFNGDFNWFNIDPHDFEAINEEVLAHNCVRGNVETEIASGSGEAGCGCGYPDWVDDNTVAASNTIMEQLARTASGFPKLCERLAALPMNLVAEVGGLRVGVVHGDAESLAGWNFSQEALTQTARSGTLDRYFHDAEVCIFACTHTGLPVCQDFEFPQGRCLVINNGDAGLPNFRNTQFGLCTRISTEPATGVPSLYGTRLEDVYVDAVPVHYDHAKWSQSFLANWSPGSPAHAQYIDRVVNGPDFSVENAVRGKVLRTSG
jgi:predicted phosphodiesterase